MTGPFRLEEWPGRASLPGHDRCEDRRRYFAQGQAAGASVLQRQASPQRQAGPQAQPALVMRAKADFRVLLIVVLSRLDLRGSVADGR